MKLLARGLAQIEGIQLDNAEPETNILYFRVAGAETNAQEFTQRLEARGVSMSALGAKVRAVTHLDVTRADVERAIQVVTDVVASSRA